MEYSRIISEIRKNKGIKVSDITDNNMSRSSYNRYISGETDLYSTHLIEILERLHVSLPELEYISHGYANSDHTEFLRKIKVAFARKDINYLKVLRMDSQKKSVNEHDFNSHMVGLIDLLLYRFESKQVDLLNNSLYRYLINTNTWTRYELVLFTNSLFYWSPEILSGMLNRAVTQFSKLDDLMPYGIDSFRLLSNAIICFIYHHDYKHALHYIDMTEKYRIENDYAYEHLILKYIKGVKLVLLGYPENQTISHFNKCISIAEELEMNDTKEMFVQTMQDLYKQIKVK